MKQINIDLDIIVKDFESQTQLKIPLNQAVNVELCMALFLLKENITNLIGIKFRNFLLLLKVSNDHYSYCESVKLQENIMKGIISIDAIEYILKYLLTYYKDKVAETEHIDVDFLNTIGKEFTITINSRDYYEYSSTEIKKRLK